MSSKIACSWRVKLLAMPKSSEKVADFLSLGLDLPAVPLF
jgi:hypothetical protein